MENIINIISSIIQTVVGIVSIWISVWALSLSVNTYRMTMDEFSPKLIIQKDADIIKIKNKDNKIFNITSLYLERVDNYWLEYCGSGYAVNLSTFSYIKNLDDVDFCNLNEVEIDTTSIYYKNEKNNITKNEQQILLKNIFSKLNTMNIKSNYRSTQYYYRLNLNYEQLKYTVNEFSKTPYYDGITIGLDENLFIEDVIAYKTIYSTLLITMMYSADKNQRYSEWNWISQEMDRLEIKSLRALQNSPYFNCGGVMMNDSFFLPQTFQIANEFYDVGLDEVKGKLSYNYKNDVIDYSYENYKFK